MDRAKAGDDLVTTDMDQTEGVVGCQNEHRWIDIQVDERGKEIRIEGIRFILEKSSFIDIRKMADRGAVVKVFMLSDGSVMISEEIKNG